jgi:hypothetical protein
VVTVRTPVCGMPANFKRYQLVRLYIIYIYILLRLYMVRLYIYIRLYIRLIKVGLENVQCLASQ